MQKDEFFKQTEYGDWRTIVWGDVYSKKIDRYRVRRSGVVTRKPGAYACFYLINEFDGVLEIFYKNVLEVY